MKAIGSIPTSLTTPATPVTATNSVTAKNLIIKPALRPTGSTINRSTTSGNRGYRSPSWPKVTDSFVFRSKLPDTWLHIACICRHKRRCEQILFKETQTASLLSLFFHSESNKSANRWGVRGCISCRAAPRYGKLVTCQPCHDKALRMAPLLIEVPEDHDAYKSGTSGRHSIFGRGY